MFRRVLQFVLMVSVLVGAPAAQVFAMPCCVSGAAATSADDHAGMQCHGAMEHIADVLSAVSDARCDAATCRKHIDTATLSTERIASKVLQVPADVFLVAPVRTATARSSSLPSEPPLLYRHSAIPLRV